MNLNAFLKVMAEHGFVFTGLGTDVRGAQGEGFSVLVVDESKARPGTSEKGNKTWRVTSNGFKFMGEESFGYSLNGYKYREDETEPVARSLAAQTAQDVLSGLTPEQVKKVMAALAAQSVTAEQTAEGTVVARTKPGRLMVKK